MWRSVFGFGIAPRWGADNLCYPFSIAISPLSAVSDRQAAGAIQSLYATYGGRVIEIDQFLLSLFAT